MKKSSILSLAIILAASAAASPAFAQNIGNVVQNVTNNLEMVPTMLGTIFQFVGIWYGGKACFALKEMSEEGRDQSLAKKSLLYGVAGVAMVSLPMAMGIGMQTLFNQTTGNLTQEGARNILIR
jgi:hypothetical protein